MRRREKGKAYGPIRAKTLAVLEAFLWSLHNAKTGLCFPSIEKNAEAVRILSHDCRLRDQARRAAAGG
jgi:hypothetical protein